MGLNKESRLIQDLIVYLQSDDIKIGDRLASERALAGILGYSRNSVRNAIKMFQAKGILEVRPSSGYYLKTKSDLGSLLVAKDEDEEKGWIGDQLEAFYMFEPQGVMLATRRMSEEDIKTLEECVIQLSKAMLENNVKEIVSNHKGFHEIIARGTGNKAIVQMMQRLEYTYELIANVISKISKEERENIFARHVNLFQSISARDKNKAFEVSQEMVLSISGLLNRFEGVELPDSIKDALNRSDHTI